MTSAKQFFTDDYKINKDIYSHFGTTADEIFDPHNEEFCSFLKARYAACLKYHIIVRKNYPASKPFKVFICSKKKYSRILDSLRRAVPSIEIWFIIQCVNFQFWPRFKDYIVRDQDNNFRIILPYRTREGMKTLFILPN